LRNNSDSALLTELADHSGQSNECLIELVQIVQASELSSPANALSNDLVIFANQVLDSTCS